MRQSFASRATYWLMVVSLGLILGTGLQFASAWTAPTAAPPGGNVAGPVTTSVTEQVKLGTLELGGLRVRNDVHLATNAGNIGIGTTTPSQKLSVNGNIETFGAGNGIIFPDGTKQTTAAGGDPLSSGDIVYRTCVKVEESSGANHASCAVDCPANYKAIGGGCSATGSTGPVPGCGESRHYVYKNEPINNNTAWQCSVTYDYSCPNVASFTKKTVANGFVTCIPSRVFIGS